MTPYFPGLLESLIPWETMSQNVIISNSGGRTSAFMDRMMRNHERWKERNLVSVFANTGKEREETLAFVDRCDREFGLGIVWVEAVVSPEDGVGTTFKRVTFETAARNGEPFEEMIKHYGIPNVAYPHCTRELKQRPINAYARSLFGQDYVSAIGIRIDEPGRIKMSPDFVYPLLDHMTTKQDVRQFWNQQPFDLQLKDYEGNCDLCFKKSLRKQLTMLKENPSMADWWHRMEVEHSSNGLRGEGTFHFHRHNKSTTDLLELSKHAFIPVTDPFWKADRSDGMDDEQPCSCMNSSEMD